MIHMLIVDDEEDIGEYIADVVRDLKLDTVKSVVTGEQALELIGERDWSVIMVDLKLSTAVTGLDVMRAAREKNKNTIVIAMTGYIDIDLKQKVDKLEVFDLLEKPAGLAPGPLTAKLKEALAKLGDGL